MHLFSIDRSQKLPIIRQIYEQIRLNILSGELSEGEKLPSTRDLAENLQVSRNVVLEAYEQLIAEGYMTSIRGSGTYVAEGAYFRPPNLERSSTTNGIIEANGEDKDSLIDFRFGIPELDLFTRKKWSSVYQQVCTSSPASVFGYGTPQGSQELREVLAHYLVKTRGLYCEPDQVIITTGAIQAVYLAANLLLSSNDQVVTEDPMNIDIRKIFQDTGAQVVPIPVDNQGIKVEQISDRVNPRLIYLTPSHQFPLGGTLPIQRRIELIEIARQKGCYILEDNYDNEYRFEGTQASSLQGLDPNRVIYTGTFSKILSPAFRIGYMVVPALLADDFCRLKNLLDHPSPSLNQLVLAQFIKRGDFGRHIAKMKKIYRKRLDAIIENLAVHFPGRYSTCGHSTGFHLSIQFDGVEFTQTLVENLEKAGVRVYPVEMYTANKGLYRNYILLGYGHVNEDEIIEGIKRIKSVIKDLPGMH